MSFSSGLQKSDRAKPRVKAKKKLDFHQKEAQCRQSQDILDKYKKMMNSRKQIDDAYSTDIARKVVDGSEAGDTCQLDSNDERLLNSPESIIDCERNEENIMREDSSDLKLKSRRNSYPRSPQSTEGLVLRRKSAPPVSEVRRSTQLAFPLYRGTLEKNVTPPLRPCRPQTENAERTMERNVTIPHLARQEIRDAQRVIGTNLTSQPHPGRPEIRGAEKRYVQTRYERPEDWIYVNENTRFHIDVWERIKCYSDSRFIREVATKLWGTEDLQKRCLNAAKANKEKEDYPEDELRKELTPEKYNTLKDCLYNKLTDAGITGKVRDYKMRKTGAHMRSKIYDVRRRR